MGGITGPPPTITSPERPPEPKPEPAKPTTPTTPAGPGPANPTLIAVMLMILRAGGYLPADSGDEWTDETEEALRTWQEDNGLVGTGVIDSDTSGKVGELIGALPDPEQAGQVATQPTAAPEPGQGGGAGEPAATTTAPAGEPNPDGKFGIPGGAQIWKNEADGYWYVVYIVPGTYIPLAWRIESNDDVAAIFGPGNEWKIDRTVSGEEWQSLGVLSFGPSRQLANLSEHPFDAFVANFETEAAIRPWLRDPEILALTTRAILEGRSVTDAELAGTEWWKTHTEGERAWIAEYNRDPATAQQKVTDSRDQIRQTMIRLGISEPPERLVNLIADRVTGGTWTQQYAQSQISKLADPAAPGTLDATLSVWVQDLADEGVVLNTLADNTARVDALLRTWLGPTHAANFSKAEKERWAGRLRNDPQAEEEFVETVLKPARMSLFPEYQDPNLSYEAIAGPWRGVWASVWGTEPDETDPLFERIMRVGGGVGTKDQPGGRLGVEQILRAEGLQRGVGSVGVSALQSVGAAFGGTVRRAM